MGLDVAVDRGLEFGRQCVWTYGPLGFLATRTAYGLSKSWIIAFDLFVVVSLFAIFSAVFSRDKRPGTCLLCLASALVTKHCLMTFTPAILFTVLLFWLLKLWEAPNSAARLAVAFTTLVLFYLKASYSFLAVAVFLAVLAAAAARGRIGWVAAFATVGGCAAAIAVTARELRVDLQAYARSGWHLISGYEDAMTLPIVMAPLSFYAGVAVLLACAVFVVVNVPLLRIHRALALVALLTGFNRRHHERSPRKR